MKVDGSNVTQNASNKLNVIVILNQKEQKMHFIVFVEK